MLVGCKRVQKALAYTVRADMAQKEKTKSIKSGLAKIRFIEGESQKLIPPQKIQAFSEKSPAHGA